ncbi:MAG: LysR family [Verrucomicrobia bacterium]|nr:MAG: LysR family [Verrucomicrobiota bacterium]
MKTDRRFFKELRIRQLRALVEIARRKSFSAVASYLKLSVVSVWRQVRSLEDEFEVKLVNAEGQQVTLTEEGRMLVEMSEPLVENFLSLRAAFADRRNRVPRRLTVAAPADILSDELPEPIKAYRKQFPDVELRLVDRPSRGAAAALLAGQADIAIIGMGIGMPDELEGAVDLRPLTRYSMALLCPAGHPLAGSKKLTLRQIAQHPLVLGSEDTSDRLLVDQTFKRAGLLEKIDVALSATRVLLIMRYVALDFGVALLAPGSHAPFKPKRGEKALISRDVSHLFGYEEVVLLRPKGGSKLPHIDAFCDLVANAMEAGGMVEQHPARQNLKS